MTDQKQRLSDAGRELDARVAEKLFGWSNLRWMDNIHRVCGVPPVSFMEIPQAVPRYSESIEAAFQVVEKMAFGSRAIEFHNALDGRGKRAWWVVISDEQPYGTLTLGEGVADTLPHAICLAALKAIEATEKESTLRTPEDK